MQKPVINHVMVLAKKDDVVYLMSSRVLIVASQGPRDKMLEKQYFAALYRKDGIEDAEYGSRHLIYVEMLPWEFQDLNINRLVNEYLAGHELNKQIGQSMLGTEQAMFSDVLCEYGPHALEQLDDGGKCPYRV